MQKLSESIVSRFFTILLTCLIFLGSAPLISPAKGIVTGMEDKYATALNDYHNGAYERAAEKLEQILDSQKENKPEFKAKIFLLLGACYGKLNKKNEASTCFAKLKQYLDEKRIKQVPTDIGINPYLFPEYRKIFAENSFFTHKQPVPVSEMMEQNVVHAPRKPIEQKEKEKKRKKFPWLIAVGAAVIIGVTAILLLTQKKKSGEMGDFREIEWVQIPAGEFLMGDNFEEGDTDELPVHKVHLDEYSISKYEITSDQYNWFCEDTGRQKLPVLIPTNTKHIGKYPAFNVSYFDAIAFCNWLSRRTGKNIQLPTEAQWEKAARGTQQYRYPWGNDSPHCGLALYTECLDNEFTLNSQVPVHFFNSGSSPHDVFNMAGNAAEWCRDWYGKSYYSISPENNPKGPNTGTFRVVRGGSCYSSIEGIRSAKRDFARPVDSGGDLGFRVVMEDNGTR
ncbi:SUMF1/EgtB/PvdO family nonheme iron enzyme [Acidobacteriota bacterium]